MLSGKGKIAGVIGWPVAHSVSPKLHNYWLARYRIDGAYVPLPVKPEELPEVIRALPKMGFRGVNLTLPHKELVVPLLDELDEEARVIGAVNTVIIGEGGRLRGTNTDAYGFIKNVRPHLPEKLVKAVVLGAGGAARAVCHALSREGFSTILLANRTPEKANLLAAQFSRVTNESWENRNALLEGADLLVNTTNLGMEGKEPLNIDLRLLPKQSVVTDLVYTPLVTPLLRKAKEAGHPVVDGLGMLMHQAVPAFKAWYNMAPEVNRELRHYLTSE